jgi:hypothetical protein
MPSLKTIFFVATAALASFVSAAPLGALPAGLNLPNTGVINAGNGLPVPPVGSIGLPGGLGKRGEPDSLPVVLGDLETKLNDILNQLSTFRSCSFL